MPFTSGQPLVRQCGDKDWLVEEPIVYQGRSETFVVPVGYNTDFASVPRIFTWLLPTYGRYTRPAILHDWLCTLAREGKISRLDADGLFRRSMRELGVAFLRRRLMWAGVRVQSVADAGWKQLLHPLGSFLALVMIGTFALAYLLVPTVVILAALLVSFVLEWLLLPFAAMSRRPANRPSITWKL